MDDVLTAIYKPSFFCFSLSLPTSERVLKPNIYFDLEIFMKKKKIYIVLLGVLGFVVLAGLSAGSFVKFYLPDVGEASDIKIDITPDRIERGRYLASSVTVCMDCHSTRDWSKFAAPLAGGLGGGGEKFDKEMGFPGTLYSPNITPYGLSEWSDGEIFRAITTGVDKDGNALFSLMPYHHYGQMDEEDLYSIIAYIRTLDPIKNEIADRELDFPVSLLVNTMPVEAHLQTRPSESNTVAYGGYLVNAAGCVGCHSKTDKGAVIKGSEFGGGMEFKQPAGVVRTSNITPHPETGIGNWTKEQFVQRFKVYADSTHMPTTLTADDLNSPMPWYMYAGMKQKDLEAIYAYLKTLTPINHQVVRYEKKVK